jgi:rod shape-determining protein MreC
LGHVVAPLHRIVEAPFALQEAISSALTTRDSLHNQVDSLQAQVNRDAIALARLRALELENARLQSLLDATPREAVRTLTARVLQVDLDAVRQRVLVDRGSRDGIAAAQPVLDARGVVGQTTRVNESTAEIILLSDSNHAIPVHIERNGLRTIAVGTGSPTRLALPYLPRNADVQVGDRLTTSGLGGVFPPDLPVATVTEVRRDPSQPLVQVRATPFATLDRDREVMLAWFRTPPTLASPAAPTHPVKGKSP